MSKLAAQRALEIINNLGGAAEEFRGKWLTVQAFASEFERDNQRHSLVESVNSALSNDQAEDILNHLDAEISYLRSNPVGNLRLAPGNPRFYQNAKRDIAHVLNENHETSMRLGYLICVVYQVRCNTEHGKKELGSKRSQKLFSVCNNILGMVIPELVHIADAA